MAVVRVLVIAPAGAGLHYNGPATATFRLFSRARRRGDLHVILAHGFSVQPDHPEAFDECVLLASIVKPGEAGGLPRPLAQMRFIAAAMWLVIARRRDYDVVFTPTTNKLGLFPGTLARLLGRGLVLRVAALNAELVGVSHRKARMGAYALRDAMIRRSSAIVALSSRIAERLESLGVEPENIVHAGNGVDLHRFRPADETRRRAARLAFGIPANATHVVVCVGALTDRKGQLHVVDALVELPASVHLLLVGPARDGEIAAAVKRRLRRPELGGRVHMLDRLDTIEQAYAAGDVFVLASKDEGMPSAMVEAMACGLPVLGTRISGIEDLVEGAGTDGFVDRDASSIASALRRYLDDPSMLAHDGALCRAHVAAHHDLDTIAARLHGALVAAVPNAVRGGQAGPKDDSPA